MRFFRETVYEPVCRALGPVGSSVGVLAVMLACGAWHGAGIHFLLWGGFVAALILLERAVRRVVAVRPPSLFRRLWVVMAFLFPLAVFLHPDAGMSVALMVRMLDLPAWLELPVHIHAKLAGWPWLSMITSPVDVPFRLSSTELAWLVAAWLLILLCPSVPQCRVLATRWWSGSGAAAVGWRGLVLAAVALVLIVIAAAVRPGSNAFFYFQF